jgi:hypothetical protein
METNQSVVFTFALSSKPRRSRRLQGLEPDATPAQEPEVFRYKPSASQVPQPQPQVGVCSRLLGVVGGALATFTLSRTVVAIVCAPGYCLF